MGSKSPAGVSGETMLNFSKQLLRKTLNLLGLDIVRRQQSPMNSLLGLRRIPISTVIDVGANEGQFAKKISKFFQEARIYCFEPVPAPFKKLSEWADAQDGRIKVFNTALGNHQGIVELFDHLEHSPSSSFLRTTKTCERLYPFTKNQRSIPVHLETLDKIAVNLSEPLIPEILIKLDVQGYEKSVIEGGAETFRRAAACIAEVCLDELYENQATFKDIYLLLDNLGFDYVGNLDQVFAEDGHVVYIDAVFVRHKSQWIQ